MQPSSPEGPRQPQQYSLSVDDFKRFPRKLDQYSFPGPVTRSNVTSWFIEGFGAGGGNIDAHALWMRYVDLKTGFNSKQTLLAFEGAGGINGGISPVERAIFEDVFSKIKKHKEVGVNLLDDFDDNMHALREALEPSLPTIPEDPFVLGWETMEPQEFLDNLKLAVAKYK